MTKREQLEAEREKVHNRLELGIDEFLQAEASRTATALSARTWPTTANLEAFRRARAEAHGLHREITVDLHCLAALGLAVAARSIKERLDIDAGRIHREVHRQTALIARSN